MCLEVFDRKADIGETRDRIRDVSTPAAEPTDARPGVLARLREWLSRKPGKQAVPAE